MKGSKKTKISKLSLSELARRKRETGMAVVGLAHYNPLHSSCRFLLFLMSRGRWAMFSPNRYAWAAFVLTLLSGCSTTAMPQICNPQPASVQLAEARQYDPFPDPTIAPPIMGGRPLGFREPRPEPDVTKNRKFLLWPFAGYPQPGVVQPGAVMPPPGVVPYAPPATGPIPGNVAYPPTVAPYDPYAPQGSAPAAYGTAIPQ